MKTIQSLNEKNHFLEKFYSLNEKQLMHLTSGHYEHLDLFYNQREDILKIIKYIDSEIERAQLNDIAMSVLITTDEQSAVRECLRVKDIYVARIIEQDVQIISLIETFKNEIISELRGVRSAKRAMTGYKANVA